MPTATRAIRFNHKPTADEVHANVPKGSIVTLHDHTEIDFLGMEDSEKGPIGHGTTLNDPTRGQQAGDEDDRWFYPEQVRSARIAK